MLTCDCELYKLMEEGGKLKELLCAGSSALASEDVREKLKAAVLLLSDEEKIALLGQIRRMKNGRKRYSSSYDD